MSQILVLCEGYDDRAFWKCWLLRLGATDLWLEAGGKRNRLKKILQDGAAKSVDGDFCVRSRSGEVIVIRPVHGIDELWSAAEATLHDATSSRLILSCDSDRPAEHSTPASHRLQQLERLRGSTVVDLVVWHCDDPPGLPGVPEQQTLERLICAAIAAGQPATWNRAVEAFLRHEPVLGPNHKNYAHAYWAKFFAHDFDDLYTAVWSEERFPEIARQLEIRLRRNAAWDLVAAVAGAS